MRASIGPVTAEAAAQYGIQSIPTVAVFRDGKPVTGFVGARPATAIGQFLDDAIATPGEAVTAP